MALKVVLVIPGRYHDIANIMARRLTVLKYNKSRITIESLFIYIIMLFLNLHTGV